MKIGKHETHPLSNAFPLLEGAEFDEFVADLKANGQHHDIVLLDGRILDGRNRYRGCLAAGIPPRFQKYEGTNPLAFVVSMNLRRKHHNESQRALIAARLAMAPQGRRKTGKDAALMTQGDAAAALNVGERTVRDARAVLEHAHADVVAAIERGELTVAAAGELAKLPHAEQLERLAAAAAADTKRGRGAIVRRDTKPSNENGTEDPVTQLMRVTVRALEQLGATVGRRKADENSGRFALELAFGGHQYALALQERAA